MQIQGLSFLSQFMGEYEMEFTMTYYFRRLLIVITYTILHSDCTATICFERSLL